MPQIITSDNLRDTAMKHANIFLVDMHIYVYVQVHGKEVHILMCVSTCGGQCQRCSSDTVYLIFWDMDSHWSGIHQLRWTSWSASSWSLFLFASSLLRIQACATLPSCFTWTLGIKFSSFCLPNNTLPTVLTPRPIVWTFLWPEDGSFVRVLF